MMTIDVATLPDAQPGRSQAARRILVVFNPAAGRKRRPLYLKILKALADEGCAITTVETTAAGHAEAIARDCRPEDVDVIVAAGGDGTVNEIVNGLAGKPIVLGIMPLGTANVLADEIGIPRRPRALARMLAQAPIRTIRVGRANGRRFVMMAGTGFDAKVVASVSLELKKKIGPLAYVWETAKLAFKDSYPGCEVTIDGARHSAVSAVVCKGRYYGGPFIAVPAATVTDDLFHVVLMRGRGWTSVLRYGAALMMGRLAALPDVTIVPGRAVSITGVEGAPVQADGDIITRLPGTITVDAEPIRVVWPGSG